MTVILLIGIVVVISYWGQENFYDVLIEAIIDVAMCEVFIAAPFYEIGVLKKLKEEGMRIEADLVGVREVTTEGEKKKEYMVVAKAFDSKSGQEKEYYSDFLEHNPEKYLPKKIGIHVNPKNTEKYYMDLEFLNKFKPDDIDEMEELV